MAHARHGCKSSESYELTELIGREKYLQHTAGGRRTKPAVAKRSTAEMEARLVACSYVVIGGGGY